MDKESGVSLAALHRSGLHLSLVQDGRLRVEDATIKSGLSSKEWAAIPGSPTTVSTTGSIGRPILMLPLDKGWRFTG